VVFTDLDGTLLNEKYSCQEVKPLVSQLQALAVPIVICSSKARAEIEFYRKEIGLADPFTAENGSAIFIPKGYFSHGYAFSRQTAHYGVIELGIPYAVVRQKLANVKPSCHGKIIGFGDMTAEELAADSGLPLQLAKLAKMREYDEPFRIISGDEKQVLAAIKQEELNCTRGGRYFHLLGNCNKGKAVAVLKDLYIREFGETVTFGVGDSTNDWEMLQMVDVPFVVGESADAKNVSDVWKTISELVKRKAACKPEGEIGTETKLAQNCTGT